MKLMHLNRLIWILGLCLPLVTLAEQRGTVLHFKNPQGQTESVKLYDASYALLIGVSDYKAGWQDLQSVIIELNNVEKALKDQGFSVYKYANTTSTELKQYFNKFVNDHGFDSNNRLLFFFSGHGYSFDNEAEGYLVPSDAPLPKNDKKGFLQKAFFMTDILAWARKIKSKHALFLFDSCFSGTVFQVKTTEKLSPYIDFIAREPVRQFITAGGAQDKLPAKSTFTPMFIDALRYQKGDLNKDGYVTGRELGYYLSTEVPNHTIPPQYPEYGVITEYSLSRGDFIFEVGKQKIATESSLIISTMDLPINTPSTSLNESKYDRIDSQHQYNVVPYRGLHKINNGLHEIKEDAIWWSPEGTHNDAFLLSKPVRVNTCIDSNNKVSEFNKKIPEFVVVGAWVHPLSVRTKSWSELLNHGRLLSFGGSIGVSILPYILVDDEKYPLSLFKREHYYPSCTPIISESQYHYPYNYPSLLFKPTFGEPSLKDRLNYLLHKKSHFPPELTQKPLVLHTDIIMWDLLKALIHNKDGSFFKKLPPIDIIIPGCREISHNYKNCRVYNYSPVGRRWGR